MSLCFTVDIFFMHRSRCISVQSESSLWPCTLYLLVLCFVKVNQGRLSVCRCLCLSLSLSPVTSWKRVWRVLSLGGNRRWKDELTNGGMQGWMESFLTTAVDSKEGLSGFICFSDMPVQAITTEKNQFHHFETRFSPFCVSVTVLSVKTMWFVVFRLLYPEIYNKLLVWISRVSELFWLVLYNQTKMFKGSDIAATPATLNFLLWN